MKLGVTNLTRGLEYHGSVTGKRQTYYVLSGARMYFVMSLSAAKRASGNFNLGSKALVDKLHRRLRGQLGVTAKAVYSRTRDSRSVPSSLAALNMPYILVATERASIDRRLRSREIYFNVRPEDGANPDHGVLQRVDGGRLPPTGWWRRIVVHH